MKTRYLKIIAVALFCWITLGIQAQTASESIGKEVTLLQPDFSAKLSIGIKLGASWTTISQSNWGRIDETYTSLYGGDIGVTARYAFTDWFALRADLSTMTRSYRMDRNLNYLDPVYTNHINRFVMLPIMADFSFGGKQLQGHAYCGGYGSYWWWESRDGRTYWMTDYYVYFENFDEDRKFNSEDQRFIGGVVGGLGVSYSLYGLSKKDIVSLDVLYYYDLVSHHKGHANLSDPRYLNTLTVTIGWAFSF